MIFSVLGSRLSPLPKAMRAASTCRMSRGAGSKVCGSAPAGASENTSTRSPPTSRTNSANKGSVVTTFTFPSPRVAESPPAQAASSAAKKSATMMAAIRVTAGAPSPPGARGDGAAAGGAAPVELQPVTLDLVLGGGRPLTDQAAHGALVQVLHVAAGDADQVVVVSAAANPVVQAAVLQEDAADPVGVPEEAH